MEFSGKKQPSDRICKAYKNGRCINPRTGKDTGPCSSEPANWQNWNVVKENSKYYGKW